MRQVPESTINSLIESGEITGALGWPAAAAYPIHDEPHLVVQEYVGGSAPYSRIAQRHGCDVQVVPGAIGKVGNYFQSEAQVFEWRPIEDTDSRSASPRIDLVSPKNGAPGFLETTHQELLVVTGSTDDLAKVFSIWEDAEQHGGPRDEDDMRSVSWAVPFILVWKLALPMARARSQRICSSSLASAGWCWWPKITCWDRLPILAPRRFT